MPCDLPAGGQWNCLAAYTQPELIVHRLQATDPPGIIKELTLRLKAQGIISDVLSFYHAALNHDLLTSSALPAGIALPHARSPQVTRLTFALGHTDSPVVWGTRGSWGVDQIYLIAIPPTDASEYLTLLSNIASIGCRPHILARLRETADARNLYEVLNKIILRTDRKTPAPYRAVKNIKIIPFKLAQISGILV